MYKRSDASQHTFLDFNQSLGMHMDSENRWVRMADRIPWDEFEFPFLSACILFLQALHISEVSRT